MTTILPANILFALLAIMVSTSCGMQHDTRGRNRRSDDSDPLEAVVSGLSQKVDTLMADNAAQNAALNNQISSLQSRLDAVEQPVAFTVRFTGYDVTGLGNGQTLKYDYVDYNAGSGYNPTTGIFTAPSSGTYAFYITVMSHSGDSDEVELALNLGDTKVTYAYACCHQYSQGFAPITTHLAAGDIVYVTFDNGNDHTLWGGVHTAFSGIKVTP